MKRQVQLDLHRIKYNSPFAKFRVVGKKLTEKDWYSSAPELRLVQLDCSEQTAQNILVYNSHKRLVELRLVQSYQCKYSGKLKPV